MKIGILRFKHTNSENILSSKALFFAIPFDNFILFANSSSKYVGYSKKSNPNLFVILFDKSSFFFISIILI